MKNLRLDQVGELELVRQLCRRLPSRSDVVLGPGDDCAVVRLPSGSHDWLLKSDPVIEGIHFEASAEGNRIGRKAAARVLSDVADMGGEPLWLLVNIVAAPDTPAGRLQALMAGLAARARRFGAAVVGGDVSAGPALEAHVFAVGRVAKGQAIQRTGARAGDVLFVSGSLGGSGDGRHLDFMPRVAEGRWLARGRWVSAMLDLSDGLASDLPRLCRASGVGACLELDSLPLAPALRRQPDRSAAQRQALTDGEDYELLLAVKPNRERALMKAWRSEFRTRLTRIGVCTVKHSGIVCLTDDGQACPLQIHGFEHFTET